MPRLTETRAWAAPEQQTSRSMNAVAIKLYRIDFIVFLTEIGLGLMFAQAPNANAPTLFRVYHFYGPPSNSFGLKASFAARCGHPKRAPPARLIAAGSRKLTWIFGGHLRANDLDYHAREMLLESIGRRNLESRKRGGKTQPGS
ncbi:MAG: hypothetical protein P8Z79_23120 [Sedimentisphaerales bacterium]